ncbi:MULTISPECIES: hypothetical protein [Thalassospira]|uniref:hypothetical protein n=1 Tax=Thalassospira TaxID=168934 RepID=UPI0008DCDA8E|nr:MULTISPECIES: hypothetical protein [Thalassospira]MDM7975397.1 hypothetical protein [Thalassospira xiamenensis]OHZ00834.1 hypothetical protein BC440_08240 [Thalassospira sp. MIT1004]
MSYLPAPNTALDGIIKWARDQLGRHPTEGEITVVRVAMEMQRRRQEDRQERRQQAAEAAAVRRRQNDEQEEDDFKKRMAKEIDDLWVWAICIILLSPFAREWQALAQGSKACFSKTDPHQIIRSGLTFKAQETDVFFETAPEQRHRALLAYIASKMPKLASGLPVNPPHYGVDKEPGFYDIAAHGWEIRTDLHPYHLALINAQRPERIKAIFQEVAAVSPFDSGVLMDKIAREGELAIPAIRDWPSAFAFTPGEPPMALLPEPPKPDLDDLLNDTEGLDLDGDTPEFQP